MAILRRRRRARGAQAALVKWDWASFYWKVSGLSPRRILSVVIPGHAEGVSPESI